MNEREAEVLVESLAEFNALVRGYIEDSGFCPVCGLELPNSWCEWFIAGKYIGKGRNCTRLSCLYHQRVMEPLGLLVQERGCSWCNPEEPKCPVDDCILGVVK